MAERAGRTPLRPPRRVHGIDFSGAEDAGRRIWITTGAVENGRLRVEACRPAAELPHSGQDRDTCLAALRELIAGDGACAVGLDFPFGLPAALVQAQRWEDFIRAFRACYTSAAGFSLACRTASGGLEWKRMTDRESRTPFCAYNLRLYRQTYYGIRELLHPLVSAGLACALPMQLPRPGMPWLFEICPASTLTRARLRVPYKGRTAAHRAARAGILLALQSSGELAMRPTERRRTLDDPGGDALDSVIAALVTFQVARDPARLGLPEHPAYAVEGFVYV